MTAQQQALLAKHNAIRAEHGLSPCHVHEGLMAAAQEHAVDMAARGRLSHAGMSQRAAEHGWTGNSLGENVAEGYPTVEIVFDSWMRSPGHRGNILGNYDSSGYGCASDASGSLWWCGMFGLESSSPPPVKPPRVPWWLRLVGGILGGR